jgi:hypothetical protein
MADVFQPGKRFGVLRILMKIWNLQNHNALVGKVLSASF